MEHLIIIKKYQKLKPGDVVIYLETVSRSGYLCYEVLKDGVLYTPYKEDCMTSSELREVYNYHKKEYKKFGKLLKTSKISKIKTIKK